MYLTLATEDHLRGYAAHTTHLAEEARQRHGTAPTATVALGKALTAAALMSGLLKTGQRVALKWQGTGPLERIVVEGDARGRLRGYVGQPGVDLPPVQGEYDLLGAIGAAGLLTVVRDLRLPELAESTVHLATSDIDGDLAYFLDTSDQVPSAVVTGVWLNDDGSVAAAGGVLVQPLPPYRPDEVEQIKERLAELPPVAALLQEDLAPEEILNRVFAHVKHGLLSTYPLRFECHCSREQTMAALAALGSDDLRYLLETDREVTIDCRYCHESYVFDSDDLESLLATMAAEGSAADESEEE